ncbi:MAG TPA: spore photoproduct lyase, partial [Firmicutes bacterium]|nr:spore photoproduct lyase [Bacillota bacterium]
MKLFIPTRAFFEPAALEYPLGKKIYEELVAKDIPIKITTSHNRVLGIPDTTP